MITPVSFGIAKLLEEKWFNEPCIQQYYYDGELLFCVDVHGRPMLKTNEESYSDSGGDCISAPTIAQVVMWLYEKHEILIGVICDVGNDLLFTFKIYSTKIGEERCIVNGNMYESLIETYEAAIEYTLNNLIL